MRSSYYFETPEHVALRRRVREFAEREIFPHAHEWEEREEFPRALYQKAAAAGFPGYGYPTRFGGAGGDVTHIMVIGDELVGAGHSVGTAVGLGSYRIALPPIVNAGTDEQQRRFIPPVLAGEKIAALAITEPDAGSDVAAIQTTAVRDGDDYIVNGTKKYITSGVRADLVTTAVRTGGPTAASGRGHDGISLLVVERGMPGFSVVRKLKKMGWWATDTGELRFDNCRVPVANRIGPENGGFVTIMQNFVTERLMMASQAVAMAELAYCESIAYAKGRRAFGTHLAGFQVTRHKLADMSTRIAAARALAGEVAARYVQGDDDRAMAARAKNAATDALAWVVNEAVQIHGARGFARESVVERLYRDARLYSIGGGTREIMNEIIAKAEAY